MNKTEVEQLKKWFEANYLDGDVIQEGQMITSSECFEAVKAGVSEQKARLVGEILSKKVWVEFGTHDGGNAVSEEDILSIINKQ